MSKIVETLINLGLGKPAELPRFRSGDPVFAGNAVVAATTGSRCVAALCETLANTKASIYYPQDCEAVAALASNGKALNIANKTLDFNAGALLFDGTGIGDSAGLKAAYGFFHPLLRKLRRGGRVIILARPHRSAGTAEQAAAQRGLEGLSRSIAKELGKKGATAQIVYVESGAEANLTSTLNYLLSGKSAYINGQALRVRTAEARHADWALPLVGKTALVTGASRGIGAAIARTLANDGATVLGLDIKPMGAELHPLMRELQGEAMVADITAKSAPQRIADKLRSLGGADIVVHNAGVTRDKTLANMPEHWWDMTLDINLGAAQRINRALLEGDAINPGGRIIGVSSMNGIAGQRGQTNYATSKAGVIGYVEYMAEELAERDITVNAVAPGFIETQMTAAIPVLTREVGRRLNSLSQGGQPEDVAEAIAFFANPASNGVSGNVLRVCGQSWLGA